nr:hypothetical protein [Acetomicrobium mobile]
MAHDTLQRQQISNLSQAKKVKGMSQVVRSYSHAEAGRIAGQPLAP